MNAPTRQTKKEEVTAQDEINTAVCNVLPIQQVHTFVVKIIIILYFAHIFVFSFQLLSFWNSFFFFRCELARRTNKNKLIIIGNATRKFYICIPFSLRCAIRHIAFDPCASPITYRITHFQVHHTHICTQHTDTHTLTTRRSCRKI